MATQSLYRRYRPRRFSEVKGQDHVVRALRNSVAEGREGQAYLFSGPRGTGKTTSARILAKVLNCENPAGGEPCCECAACLSVERGTSYDVHELDAASNNGVEAMRDLIEKASLGTPGRHKVYILDEVHMLSKGAEAALLKTLEEPPPHVVFVLATTDPQKVSDTIRSRTQHLQFHLLPADLLAEHVRWVVDDAGLTVDPDAIDDVLALGGGSARDTLSALELIASSGGGRVESITLDEFVEAMIEREPGRALTMVAQAISLGRDPRTLTEELIAFLRNGFLSLMAPELVQLPSDRVDVVADLARRLGAPGLVRGIEVLGSALVEMRQAPDPRVLLDVAVVQLTADAVAADVTALLTRLDRLEQRVAEAPPAPPTLSTSSEPVDAGTGRAKLGGRARDRSSAAAPEPAADATATLSTAKSTDSSIQAAENATSAAEAEPAVDVESGTVPGRALTAADWDRVRAELRKMAKALYAPLRFVDASAGVVTLGCPNETHRRKCEQERSSVESALTALAGEPTTVALVIDDPPPDGSEDADDTSSAAGAATASGGSSAAGAETAPAEPDASRRRPDETAGTSRERSAEPDDDIDLDDLVEAPPEAVKTPIDRLAEAFPGSQLIDESA